MKIAIAAAMMLGLSAPLAGAPETPQDRDRVSLRALESKVDRLIGTAPCEGDVECRAAPFGAKPCGGPWKYKIYSTRGTDTTALLRQIDAFKAQSEAYNLRYGLASDCSVVSEPAVACREGRCAAVTAGAAAPAK